MFTSLNVFIDFIVRFRKTIIIYSLYCQSTNRWNSIRWFKQHIKFDKSKINTGFGLNFCSCRCSLIQMNEKFVVNVLHSRTLAHIHKCMVYMIDVVVFDRKTKFNHSRKWKCLVWKIEWQLIRIDDDVIILLNLTNQHFEYVIHWNRLNMQQTHKAITKGHNEPLYSVYVLLIHFELNVLGFRTERNGT